MYIFIILLYCVSINFLSYCNVTAHSSLLYRAFDCLVIIYCLAYTMKSINFFTLFYFLIILCLFITVF